MSIMSIERDQGLEALQRGVPEAGLRELFSPHLDGMDADLLRGVRLASSVLHDIPPPLPALPRVAASNSWVVTPERTAGGRFGRDRPANSCRLVNRVSD